MISYPKTARHLGNLTITGVAVVHGHVADRELLVADPHAEFT